MNYPTIEQVNAAPVEQLRLWQIMLPAAGSNVIDRTDLHHGAKGDAITSQVDIRNRILYRLDQLNGGLA